ncbi:hypothetical protein B0H12DRAFT_1122906 [Mycena haematopus]|nr:hypothetical protein B0H12DRAFT_1122906 [Mycena haematopus]
MFPFLLWATESIIRQAAERNIPRRRVDSACGGCQCRSRANQGGKEGPTDVRTATRLAQRI